MDNETETSDDKQTLMFNIETVVEEIKEEKEETEEKPNDPIISHFDTLVLSGNSSNALVTIGALQYAKDNFLIDRITTYIGTSSGSILSFLLSIGYTPIEIIVFICTHEIMEKLRHFDILSMINGGGAASFNDIQEQLEKMTISKIGYLPTLQDLKTRFNKTLIFITYNLTEEKTENLTYETHPNLPCITALRMSSNLPFVFENFKYGNNFYIDGGISNNFAIDIGDSIGKKILGISLSMESQDFDPNNNILEYMYKLMCIPISQSISHKISCVSDRCKIIQLKSNKVKIFDFNIDSKTKLELFSNGYQQMKSTFE